MTSHRKPHLPEKNCARCGRQFTWRKKWERDWDAVRYCSERCRRSSGSGSTAQAGTASLTGPRA